LQLTLEKFLRILGNLLIPFVSPLFKLLEIDRVLRRNNAETIAIVHQLRVFGICPPIRQILWAEVCRGYPWRSNVVLL